MLDGHHAVSSDPYLVAILIGEWQHTSGGDPGVQDERAPQNVFEAWKRDRLLGRATKKESDEIEHLKHGG